MQTDDRPDPAALALLHASRAIVAVAARSLAELDDVTIPQFRALVLLSVRPGSTVSDLADALDIHPTTATRLLDRLVAKRLVRREQSKSDRRRVHLHLTAGGRRLVRSVTERRLRAIEAIVEKLDPATRGDTIAALDAFAAAAGEPDAVDVFAWIGDET